MKDKTSNCYRVIIYGASSGGRNVLDYLNNFDEYNVIAFSDSDKDKHGEKFCKINVISPDAIIDLDFDFIFIGSIFVNEIKEKLINLKIDETKIKIPYKNNICSNNAPFRDKKILQYANNCITEFFSIFSCLNVECSLSYGTLLGIYRDNNIIEWDTDIDLYLFSKDIEKHTPALIKVLTKLNSSKIYKWSYSIFIDNKKDTVVEHKLKCNDDNSEFDVSFTILKHDKKQRVYRDLCSVVPEDYFRECASIPFSGSFVKIPVETEEYLKLIYGSDWRTPRENCNIGDFNYSFDSNCDLIEHILLQ